MAPFLHPDLEWDFRLPQVKSINVSGHKYGLTYPGVGFVVWRSQDDLPDDLVFHVNYLGGDMPTFTLNFSRPGNQIVGQYYNFVRLGREGYTRIMETLRDIAVHLSAEIAEMDAFEVISDGSAIPVIAFTVADPSRLHRVPRLRPAAHVGLAGAGVHDAATTRPTSPCCGSSCARASAWTWPTRCSSSSGRPSSTSRRSRRRTRRRPAGFSHT